MTRSTPLRTVLASVLAFALTFGATAAVYLVVRRDRGPDVAEAVDGALTVQDLIRLPSTGPVDVVATGYVFSGEVQTILCSGRDAQDPPYCEGVSVRVERLDASRIDFVVPEDAPAFSRGVVTLAGRYDLGVLTVREILQ